MQNDTTWVYIAQVHAGAFAIGFKMSSSGEKEHVSLTTYGSLEHLLESEKGNIGQDAWVVDARALSDDVVIHESVAGPMVSSLIEADEVPMGPMSYVTPKTKAERWAAVGALTWKID